MWEERKKTASPNTGKGKPLEDFPGRMTLSTYESGGERKEDMGINGHQC